MPQLRRPGIALVLALALAAPALGGINRWTRNGPEGATVRALAVDPATPDVVYAGLDRGRPTVWKSASAGASWTPAASLEGETILQLEVDPVSSGTLFAVTGSNSLYRSKDGAGSWQRIGPGPFVLAVAVAATLDGKGSVLYAATVLDLWKSVDGGNAWSRTNLGNGAVSVVATAPKDARVVLAVSLGVLVRSADGAASWQAVPDSRLQGGVRSLWIHPHSPTVYAAFGSGESANVFRSDDAGLTWAPSAVVPIGKSVLSLALNPDNPLSAIAGTPQGLSRTDDGGGSWNQVQGLDEDYEVSALRFDPADSSRLYAGTARFGVLLSTDGGRTWGRSNRGLALADVTSLAAGSQPVLRLYATANNCGLVRSDDGGRTWPCVNASLSADSLAVDPTNSAIVYALTGNSYFRSSDAGSQFEPSTSPPWLFALPGNSKMLTTGGPPDTIYYRWTICTDPHGFFCFGTFIDTYWVWTAGRASFQITPPPITITTIAADPSNPGTLVAGGDTIVRSVSNGGAWEVVTGPAIVHALLFDRAHPGRVYAGANNGVWTSADSGATWSILSVGLDGSPVIALVIDDDGTRLHAGVRDGGVFNYEIGTPAAALTPAPDRSLTVTLEARDPRTGNTAQGLASQKAGVSASFVLPDITGDSENPEVFVKAVDGRALNGSLWFFYGGLTDLEYTLQVTELATGRIRIYTKAAYGSCGGADTTAFPASAGASRILTAASEASQAAAETAAGCPPGSLCLRPGRDFAMTLTARDQRTGRIATGFPVAVLDTYGFFSLPDLTGNSTNPEVFVKILDATGFDGKYWFFYGGLTDVEYTLTVIDVTTGARRDYSQPPGSYCGGFDSFELPAR